MQADNANARLFRLSAQLLALRRRNVEHARSQCERRDFQTVIADTGYVMANATLFPAFESFVTGRVGHALYSVPVADALDVFLLHAGGQVASRNWESRGRIPAAVNLFRIRPAHSSSSVASQPACSALARSFSRARF
ncbi:hypothetical protein HRbin36_02387 [bacterium HR36]|nr:hypothetical protein HRbin36_02387 [bacterium HR36]